MSTRSLLVWVALVAGVEFAVRGHLANSGWLCHGGVALVSLALAALFWRGPARRAGLGLAAVLAAAAGLDAAWAAGSPQPPSPALEPLAEGSTLEGPSRDIDCAGSVAWLDVLEPAAWNDALEARPRLALVYAGSGLYEALLSEAPALQIGSPALPAPRASALGRRLEAWLRAARAERAWRRARHSPAQIDPARSPLAERYRAALLAARRAGAERALLLPAGGETQPRSAAARTRARIERAHAHLARSLAGSYGVRAIQLEAGAGGAALGELLSEAGLECVMPSPESVARAAQSSGGKPASTCSTAAT